MESTPGHVLMKKGKRLAAAFIQVQCSDNLHHRTLDSLLDFLLNPAVGIDDVNTIDWCKWIMAGGKTPDEFAGIGEFFYYGYQNR